jgi:hypothetical protein
MDGKGASLTRLAKAGFLALNGFYITAEIAIRDGMWQQEQILVAVSAV